jgi:hypothetical protein
MMKQLKRDNGLRTPHKNKEDNKETQKLYNKVLNRPCALE